MTAGEKVSSRRVRDVMTRTVVSALRETPFKELVRLTQDNAVGALPVLDSRRRVLGVVSEADLLLKEARHDQRLGLRQALLHPDDATRAAALVAEDLMSAPPLTIGPDETLAAAARLLGRRGVKHLPVVGVDGRLRGIVSRSDLLAVYLRDDTALAADVRAALAHELGVPAAERLTVTVTEGIASIGGTLADSSRIPVAVRAVRGVDGVVDVAFALDSPPRGPAAPLLLGPLY